MKRRLTALPLFLALLLSLGSCTEIQGTASASAEIFYHTSSVSSAQDSGSGSQYAPPPLCAADLGSLSQEADAAVEENGWYSSKEEVALYIRLYDRLPGNYVTKAEAERAGWHGGNVERCTGEGTAIGGDRFSNREGLLPREEGRAYTECDIDTVGESSRGAKRIVFSNDGLIYYTEDHYESFELLYGEP